MKLTSIRLASNVSYIRSWSNGVRCMSLYILRYISSITFLKMENSYSQGNIFDHSISNIMIKHRCFMQLTGAEHIYIILWYYIWFHVAKNGLLAYVFTSFNLKRSKCLKILQTEYSSLGFDIRIFPVLSLQLIWIFMISIGLYYLNIVVDVQPGHLKQLNSINHCWFK